MVFERREVECASNRKGRDNSLEEWRNESI